MNSDLDYGSTVIGVFESHDDAENAIRGLKEVGFVDQSIGIVEEMRDDSPSATIRDASEKTAAVGAAVGLGTGTAWGLGILAGFLPGIGPAVLGGTYGVLLSNAVVGAATAGLCGALVGLGISNPSSLNDTDDDHKTRTIVTVKSDDRADTACAIMNRFQHSS